MSDFYIVVGIGKGVNTQVGRIIGATFGVFRDMHSARVEMERLKAMPANLHHWCTDPEFFISQDTESF